MITLRCVLHMQGIRSSCTNSLFGKHCFWSIGPPRDVQNFRSTPWRSRWPSRSGSRPEIHPNQPSLQGAKADGAEPHLSQLWKPFAFTILFTTGSFTAAAIWQYENLRARAIAVVKNPSGWAQDRAFARRKAHGWRNEINVWWNGLTEGQRQFFPICFLNCLVFLAWRVPRFQGTMLKYFCSNPASGVLCWPMLLSTFSHYSTFHLVANMYVLHSFSSGAVASLGKEQFLGLYLSAGVISSMSSYLYKTIARQPGLSLGASGAIMAVLGYVCTKYPDTKLSIIFLPMYTFSAGTAIKVIMALDATGVLLGWKFFDHAAHLGGALFGIVWCKWGNTYIWQNREPLLLWWHALRGTPGK